MNEAITEFLTPVGPWASAAAASSGIFNIALAADTSTATDLTGASYTGLATAIAKGAVITLTSTCDIWYRWDTATGTVDQTKTAASTPANQGVLLPAGARVPERPPPGYTWLLAKAIGQAGTLVVQVSSKSENSYLAGGFGT